MEGSERVLPSRRIYVLQKYFLRHGTYRLSFAEQAPLHKHPMRIIERLMIYIVAASANFGHTLKLLWAKAWWG